MLEWSEDRSNRLSRYILRPIAQFLSRNTSREYYSILAGRTVGFKGISLERQKLSLSLRSGLHPFEVHSWIPDPERSILCPERMSRFAITPSSRRVFLLTRFSSTSTARQATGCSCAFILTLFSERTR